jgi:hypothetical protein
MYRRIGMELTVMLGLAATLATGATQAQSIFGFKVGEDLRMAIKTHQRPSTMGAQGSFAVVKWNLSSGNAVSVTASPESGSIVFIESDWGGDTKSAATDVPGINFGTTKLADIRARFKSNGFGFKSNVSQIIGGKLISLNCYQIDGSPDLTVVFVTTLPIKNVPTVAGEPQPDTGKGHLDAVILASLAYLKGIWGQNTIFDTAYHPVTWK